MDYIKGYDIIGFTETWERNNERTKYFLDTDIEFFLPAVKNAKRGRGMGGMSVYCRNEIVKYIKRIDEKCAIGIILNIDKSFTYTNENVFLMFIYLPPLESPFYSDKEVKGIFFIRRLYS